jgi:TonB family protein
MYMRFILTESAPRVNKKFPERPVETLGFFLAVSLVVHAAILWALMYTGFDKGAAREGLGGLLYGNAQPVELVDMPPGIGMKGSGDRAYSPGAQGGAKKEGLATRGRVGLKGTDGSPSEAMGRTGGAAPAVTVADTPSTADGTDGAAFRSGPDSGGSGAPGTTDAPGTGQGGRGAAVGGQPNLLLTDERVAELARKYEEDAPAGERGKSLMLDTSEVKYRKYLLDMKTRIENRWEYPQAAARNGWQGRLRIDFTVLKDGSLGSVRLDRSSNRPALDEAAITALRLSSPFAPFPEGFDIESITIHGNFEYVIYDLRGR